MGLLSRRRRPAPRARPPRPSRVGLPAPDLVGVGPDGADVVVPTGGDRRLVVGFLTTSCTSCRPFWSSLAATRDDPARPALVVVTPDPTTEDRREAIRLQAGSASTVVMSSSSWQAFGVRGSPFFVVVVDATVVAEGWASSWDELLALIPGG